MDQIKTALAEWSPTQNLTGIDGTSPKVWSKDNFPVKRDYFQDNVTVNANSIFHPFFLQDAAIIFSVGCEM